MRRVYCPILLQDFVEVFPKWGSSLSPILFLNTWPFRVAKCHGYGGNIRVKKLEGWDKKAEMIDSFVKSSFVLGTFEQLL